MTLIRIPVVMLKKTMTVLMIDSHDAGKDGDNGDSDVSNSMILSES